MTDYRLIDSGNEEKLEQFGDFVLRRPDPQALYPKSLSIVEWDKAHASFVSFLGKGRWKKNVEIPETWPIQVGGLTFSATLGSFKHVGVFPEQETNWKWMQELITKRIAEGKKVRVLNLFAYTGGATLACASAGAEVVHVDASSGIVKVANKNAELSNLNNNPVRWIVDDVKKFVAREISRGNTYEAIIMDPPSYGHGPKKEVWDIKKDFLPLVEQAKQLISQEGLFFLLNGYSAGYSPVAYENNLLSLKKKGGETSSGELYIEEKEGGRRLPAGIYARWQNA